MKSQQDSIDGNAFFRYLHVHCFIHIYRVFKGVNPGDYFSKPRFQLFKRIQRYYHSKEERQLFYNLIFTFLWEIIIGIIITLISASLNLLVPQLIKQFMEFMREKHLHKSQYSDFISKFIIVQLLRIFFSQHSKRLSHQLAIKVESTLARKLISKSLRMAKQCRDRIPQSEIIQLQNVDLKLIFTLFKNMNVIFEAPFTIIVALILLFNESSHYGFIGVYWFLIAFLIQRQLDGRMMHCNQTKLKLIQQRCNLNYDLFEKLKSAKLIGWQNLLTQKNNDLFIVENHDHDLFYSYVTLYDITLLMLPIFVVSTITLYDVNQEDPITVEQVYLMLSLLGICFNPMKSIRTISISLHDGLHSLSRLSKYFHFPQEVKNNLIQRNTGQIGEIRIVEGTEAMNTHSTFDFIIKVPRNITIQSGQRLCLLGKRNSGCTSFLEMLVGNMKRVRGKITISGKISFLPEKLFFLKDTVRENIRFFNQKITNAEIEEIYNEFGLNMDLRFNGDLQAMIDDSNKFTKTILKKIALARCLTADADIYILDNPLGQMDELYTQIVQRRLRSLQDEGKTVIVSLKTLQFSHAEDQIVILEDGEVLEYDRFTNLVNRVESRIPLFFRSNQDGKEFLQPKTGKVQLRFQQRVESALRYEIKSARSIMPIKRNFSKIKHQSTGGTTALYKRQFGRKQQNIPPSEKFQNLVMKFLTSVSFKESIFIFIIILAAEVLHIFIHFYIGHLQEQYGNQDYTKYKNLMIAEVLLTFCLAGLIYLEGQISTILATIIGNKLYRQSFKQLTNKQLTWFNKEYNVKLADKYNHDYEQIYIASHSIFGIYKNLVILIATIEFISTNRSKLIAIFIVLAAIYYSIFYIFRKIQRKIVQHYYDYKYNFVRSLEESIQGAQLFNICDLKKQVINRAEDKYIGLASYKLSASYTAYGLSLICDVLSITLLAIGIEYGIQMKIHHRGQRISVVATSIFLLMNISEVLKTIIWEMLNFQTFFSINLVPFMQIIEDNNTQQKQSEITKSSLETSEIQLTGYQLQLHNILFEELGQDFYNQVLNFKIEEGEVVHIYEKNNKCRDLLLQAFTKNLPMFNNPEHFRSKNSTIRLGGVSIKEVTKFEWNSKFGLLMQENFYYNATIRQNVNWRLQSYNENKAIEYADLLKIKKDFPRHQGNILEVKLTSELRKNTILIKKIAFLRILLRKPKVVLIKDTDEFIESLYITQILQKEIPRVTIIKISGHIEQCFDVTRIIAMDRFRIFEDDSPEKIKQNKSSKLGKQIEDINLRSYTFMKKISKKSQNKSPLILFL